MVSGDVFVLDFKDLTIDHKDILHLHVQIVCVPTNTFSFLLYSHIDQKDKLHLHVCIVCVPTKHSSFLLYSHIDHKDILHLPVLI